MALQRPAVRTRLAPLISESLGLHNYVIQDFFSYVADRQPTRCDLRGEYCDI